MKKSTVVVTVMLAADILLVGCAGTESEVESASEAGEVAEAARESGADQPAADDDAAPRGFEFASGFLEFGDFDPYTLGNDIFNPCTEITEDEFAAAGFEQMHYDPRDRATLSNGISVCSFGGIKADRVSVGFSNGNLDRALANEASLILTGYRSELLPELYVVKSKSGRRSICYTQVDTVRGGFGSQAVDLSGQLDQERVCERAISAFEELFQIHGTVGVSS